MEGADLECVDAGSGSGGTETEDVVVGDVVGEFDERGFQVFFVFEGEVTAAGEVGDGFGGFVLQGAACRDEGHGGEAQRRGELADAVEDLLAVVAFVFGFGAFFAEAAVSGIGSFTVEL